jgi:antitoxin component HigA of HigAB toxin-antitoxin module
MPIDKMIKNDRDLQEFLDRIESLWHKEDDTSRDELELLSLVVNEYEKKTMPVAPSDPIDMLKFCMDQQGLKQPDLADLVGRSRAAEILNRTRPMSLEQIRTISEAWNIPLQLLAVRPKPVEVIAKKLVAATRERAKAVQKGRTSAAIDLPAKKAAALPQKRQQRSSAPAARKTQHHA